MSTKIECMTCSDATIRLDGADPNRTYDECYIFMGAEGHYVRSADLLAAVEAECGVRIAPADAIVIERAELPGVVRHPGRGDLHAGSASVGPGTTASTARWSALSYLALAEYLAAHPPAPPVSDEDVETLADALRESRPGPCESIVWETLARRVLATGRVSVTHE